MGWGLAGRTTLVSSAVALAPDGTLLRTPRRAWLVWALAVLAYAVAVFHRGSLGVASVEAQDRFGASAAELSLFSVLQLAVYASLQVPVGVFLDRYGTRVMVIAGAVVMAGGQALLATSTSISLAVVARALVGAGDAMTFISVLRLIPAWFAPKRAPVVTQMTGILGQLGQVAATYPLVAILAAVGWEPAFLGAAAVSLVVAAAVLATVRDSPPGTSVQRTRISLPVVRRLLGETWREPGTRIGLWTHFVAQFSGNVFALLWGYPFLVVGQGRSPATAGILLSLLVLVGMGVGPTLGALAATWPFRRSILVFTIVGSSAFVWTVVLLWPGRSPLWLLVLLVVVLASNGPGSLLGFDYARTENPRAPPGQRQRHRQRRRLRRLADPHPRDRHDPRRPDAGFVHRLLADGLPLGVRVPVRAVGGRADRRLAAPASPAAAAGRRRHRSRRLPEGGREAALRPRREAVRPRVRMAP